MSDFLKKGDLLMVDGFGPFTVEKWEAKWSFNTKKEPHRLFILFKEMEEPREYIRFVSDSNGFFTALDMV
jgi:hypothetical protein